MASYLVLGAGHFGRLALTRLAAQDPAARFLVVDQEPTALAAAQALALPGVEWLAAEAIDYLAGHLEPGFPWNWLLPLAPVHVAWQWLLKGPLAGGAWEPAAVPADLEGLAPFTVRGPAGELYVSRARHRCPDDCAEPALCPVTGEERDPPLFQVLAAADLPGWRMLVVASRQLAPGIGGYEPQRLLALAAAVTGAASPVLVATACRCHGVIHGLRPKGAGKR